mgnify:FL=1
MTDRVRSNILNGYLKFALTTNIVIMIVGIAMLFLISDAYGVYAASICSASALFNCIGLTLIMRWHKNGVIFVVVASLLSAIALSITCAGWLTYSFGSIGMYIPYIIMVLYIGVLFALLFQKVRGMSSWQQMDNNLDLAHFRHIYQLSTIILLFIFVSAYFVMPPNTETELAEDDDIENLVADVSQDRLDSPNVTIEEVVSFEKVYNENNAVGNRDSKITNRIFALKHLLLSGLMPDVHNRDNLVNICMIHAGSFSEEQQEIIDWYLALDVSQQAEWNICDKVNTLSEFKETVQNKIK